MIDYNINCDNNLIIIVIIIIIIITVIIIVIMDRLEFVTVRDKGEEGGKICQNFHDVIFESPLNQCH